MLKYKNYNIYIAVFAVYLEQSEGYVEHRVQFLQRLALNCFKDKIFLASVGRERLK